MTTDMKPIIEVWRQQVNDFYEGEVMKAVHKVYVNVDKDRLVKAITDARSFYEEGYRDAINEIRAQQEAVTDSHQLNKPLTLDELRQMDGDPVWVSISNNWRESGVSDGWCLVRFHSDDDRVRVYIYDTKHGARFFAQQDYGISWWAYRQKQAEDGEK